MKIMLSLFTAAALLMSLPLSAACDAKSVKGQYVGYLELPTVAMTTIDFDGVKKAKVQIRVRESYQKLSQESVTGSYKVTASCNGVLKFRLEFGGGLQSVDHKIDFVAAGSSANPELVGLHTTLNGGTGKPVTFIKSQL